MYTLNIVSHYNLIDELYYYIRYINMFIFLVLLYAYFVSAIIYACALSYIVIYFCNNVLIVCISKFFFISSQGELVCSHIFN
jgi:hypothetical protein